MVRSIKITAGRRAGTHVGEDYVKDQDREVSRVGRYPQVRIHTPESLLKIAP